jgi:hypothetical protein
MTGLATSNPASDDMIYAAGLVGLLASVLVGSAEFSLHFTSTLDYGGPAYEFFVDTSTARLTYGHFVAIVAAPLSFVVYWHLFQRLKPAPERPRVLFMVLGIYSFAIGSVWIGSRVYPAILVQALAGATNDETRMLISGLLDRASFYNETILIGLRQGVFALSGVFVWLVASGQTSYPRWFAVLNPILVVIVCFLIYFAIPWIGGYLMPIAMNVAHFVLFVASLWLMRRPRWEGLRRIARSSSRCSASEYSPYSSKRVATYTRPDRLWQSFAASRPMRRVSAAALID